jgi:RecB family exonuclease/superfamily I DNA/RNA helicase
MPQQRLFVSDSFAVLQDAFVTAALAIKTADPLAPLTVLAPSNLLALRLRRAVAWAGRGHFGLRVSTLTEFALEVAEDTLDREGRQPLPALAAPLIVKQLLSAAETRNYFAPLAALPGFPQSFLATLADLKQAGVPPGAVRAFIARAQHGETSRHKLESLLALYERYVSFVAEHGFYDDDDLLERAASLLEASPMPTPLFLYGFYDFTALQRRLVAAALQERDVLAFFPWRAGPAYEYATPTLTWLTSLGLQYTPLAVTHTRASDLTRLQGWLFAERAPQFLAPTSQPDGSVTLLSAPGESREAREIGRQVLALVRAHDLRFHEIGVFLRNPATYGSLVAETLTGFGIPCFLPGGLPLARTQAGQALLLLCQVLAEDYARSRVLEFVGVADPPFTTLLGELAEHARPARWAAFSVEAGIVRGADEWRDRLARLAADHQADTDATAADRQALRALVAFMQKFITVSASAPRVNTWRGWAAHTLALLRAYVSPTTHTAAVEETLMRLVQLDLLGAPIPVHEWARGVTAALAAATVSVGAFDREGIFIGDLLAARGVRFRAVIVPGLVEGSFPRPLRQDPLLLDDERQYLGEFLGADVPQRRRQSEAERLLFMLAAQSADERLVLTYPRADQASGHAQVPSLYLLRAVEALSGKHASFADLDQWGERVPLSPFYTGPVSRSVDAIEFHLASVEHALASEDPAPLGYLPALAPFFSRALQAVHQRWDAERLTVCDGIIADESVRAVLHQRLFPTALVLSASALETYARCPFRYFLSAGLGLTPWEEPEQILTFQPRDRGALLHAILHDFFTRLRQTGRLPLATQDRAALARLLTQVAEEHCRRFTRTKATGFPLLWELEQERIHERLALLLQREYEAGDDFLPTAFEARFGTDMATRATDEREPFFPAGPVQFVLDDGAEIGLRGRIDRIDLSPDQRRARILDYKTGKAPRGRFVGGMALQLPLYLFAASVLRPDQTWVSAEYAHVSGSSRGTTVVFTADTWPESLAMLRQLVTRLVQGMRSGCFVATPDSCAPCPFPSICGAHAAARLARKQNDPRLDLLRQVRAIA